MSLTKFLPDAIFRVLLCVLFVESDNVDNGFGPGYSAIPEGVPEGVSNWLTESVKELTVNSPVRLSTPT
ncbi:hypothetical protein KCV00_g369, partial [Aureobasidium melanogenum]